MARTAQELRKRTTKAVATRAAAQAKPGQQASRPSSRLRDRLRYGFDNSMSRGTPALVAWLGAITLVLIVVFAVITTVTGLRGKGADQGFWKELFYSLNHALDAGFVGGDTGSWQFLLTMLVLTLAGLFIVSALIGVIAAGIDEKLAELRRGRSVVIEADHTVILGWSDSIFTIISELTIANESRRKPVVVVLAPRDKVEMEDEIRAKVPDLRGTRVICRSGSPMDIDDLRLSSHTTARSVILLAPDSEDPDSEVIKSLLALTHTEGEGDAGAGPRIVAEIRNPSNLEAARLVGTDRTVLLDIRETVAKLLVQTSRQSGAAAVYIELFDYDGDEIYFLDEHDLADQTYAQAQLAFEEATVIGFVDPDGAGGPVLNPPPDTLVGARTLVLVAEDDEGLGAARSSARPDLGALGTAVEVEPEPTQALLIGWNERAPIVLRELDKYAPAGSTLTVLTAYDDHVAAELPRLERLAVTVEAGPTTDRATLDRHVTADLDQVMVLCYSEHLGQQAADAKTLVTLLHVRDILGRLGVATPVVSEMLDDRNRVLAQVAHVDDVVVSGEIISLLVTQLSEDQRLEAVFDQLLGDEGAEVYLRPADLYVRPGQVVWATVVAGASRRGETAIGFKTGQDVVVNPDKSTVLDVGAGDRVVVLADC
ncbi:CASTOR/POLLUX-related putative ion channel [Nocardioides rubriscoriae]|uniref:CASTOR/POLLUX-related putative ion channel n=1 Tax=Nocardioides rubriscoriae TaxID=642762 RepID=UPI0011E03DF8|nr:potassium transporter TrkA [Nocardioides rubriscoriae]